MKKSRENHYQREINIDVIGEYLLRRFPVVIADKSKSPGPSVYGYGYGYIHAYGMKSL